MIRQLTPENYAKGFLMDEELMAGVTETPQAAAQSPTFVAYVLNHTTGEYLGHETYPSLEAALAQINAIPRPWTFESSKDCGGCGEGKTCTLGECGKGVCHL